jgi:hypothetical protein
VNDRRNVSDEEWLFGVGRLRYDVEIMLSTTSRPKFADPLEQGVWLLIPLERALRTLPAGDDEGFAFSRIHYMGLCTEDTDPVQSKDVGPMIGPYDFDVSANRQSALRGTLRKLGEELAHAWSVMGDAHKDLPPVPREVIEVVDWAMERCLPSEVSDPDLADALSWPPIL